MPTYAYHCARCADTFEVLQAMSEPPLTVRPSGHADVQRLISGGAGLLFRGSGFYITDYRKPGYAKQAKVDSGSST